MLVFGFWFLVFGAHGRLPRAGFWFLVFGFCGDRAGGGFWFLVFGGSSKP